MLKLEEYPEEIADSELALLTEERKLADLRSKSSLLKSSVEFEVLRDETFKNEGQRRTEIERRLAANIPYTKDQEFLATLEWSIKEQRIEVDRLRNEFAVAKLLQRDQTARLEIKD